MALSLGGVIHEVGPQDAGHPGRAIAAHANESDSAAGKALNCRDCDLGGEALGDNLPLLERNEQNAAHRFSPRLAAAIASRTLLYR
jgi:hypothetical protein